MYIYTVDAAVLTHVVGQAEHVDAAMLLLVELLTFLSHLVADQLTNVLDDHRVFLDVASREEPQTLPQRKASVSKLALIIRVQNIHTCTCVVTVYDCKREVSLNKISQG